MKTKMRIKLLDKNLVTISDRLVDQDSEFMLTPKEKHKGPVQLEICLRDKADVASFHKYLDQLVGDLPITERKVYGVKTKKTEPDLAPVEELLAEVKKNCKTQDAVIRYLRERNFKFVTVDYIQAKEFGIAIEDKHKEDYQYMVRQTKEGKDPKTDKYDPQLAFGIKFLGAEKGKLIRVYLYGKFAESLKLDWEAKSDINFKKLAFMKFPHYMIQEERDKYSLEARKLKLNPELKPSKFFLRWEPAVKELNK